jgi:hypothetical protein
MDPETMTHLITNHEYVPSRDNRCGYAYGTGAERERCGNTEDRHGSAEEPLQDSLTSHESTKRVLFHVVNCYQSWRETSLGVPNEFTDDAVRVGEHHLRLVDWFPKDEGWLANGTDTTPNDGARIPLRSALSLIDRELDRLTKTKPTAGSRRWRRGVLDARQAAAKQLQEIRDAYIAERIARRSEELRSYSVGPEHLDDV